MNTFQIQDAWLSARRLLGVAGEEWPRAFDSLDVVTLARLEPLEADTLLDALRRWPASSADWSVRDSNISGQFWADTEKAEGPASFVVWRRGNDVLFLTETGGCKQNKIARKLHTAADIAEFFKSRNMPPPGLLSAWIAATDPRLQDLAPERDGHHAAPAATKPEVLTPMKRAAIINKLGRKYPALQSALDRPEPWAKACRIPKESSPGGKQGWYYLERIEAECRARYDGTAPAPAADLSAVAQLRCIGQ